jgi:hypothetical protein
VTEEIGGEGREWAERHWRKLSWAGSETAIDTWSSKIVKIVWIADIGVLVSCRLDCEML